MDIHFFFTGNSRKGIGCVSTFIYPQPRGVSKSETEK